MNYMVQRTFVGLTLNLAVIKPKYSPEDVHKIDFHTDKGYNEYFDNLGEVIVVLFLRARRLVA